MKSHKIEEPSNYNNGSKDLHSVPRNTECRCITNVDQDSKKILFLYLVVRDVSNIYEDQGILVEIVGSMGSALFLGL